MDYNPAKTIIKEILLDYKNIKKYYDPKEDEDYPHELFNNDECVVIDNYIKFKIYTKECYENPYECLFRMLPYVFEYAECVGHEPEHVVRWLKNCCYHPVFGTYALYAAEEIMDECRGDILNLYFIPRKLAIKKLMRNRIVNEGILLKLSMKNCGLF
jgi:hypothetical protein